MADERNNHLTMENVSDRHHGAEMCLWTEKWLSGERLAPYLRASDGDIEAALELYRWNTALGQLLMRDISYFEIALRNAYNDVMESCWDGHEHWLLDNESPARRPVMRKSAKGVLDSNRINRKTIDAAAAGLPRDFSTGSLVAGLTLGFWVHLTDRSREAVIWRSGLYRAWPKGTIRPDFQNRAFALAMSRGCGLSALRQNSYRSVPLGAPLTCSGKSLNQNQ